MRDLLRYGPTNLGVLLLCGLAVIAFFGFCAFDSYQKGVTEISSSEYWVLTGPTNDDFRVRQMIQDALSDRKVSRWEYRWIIGEIRRLKELDKNNLANRKEARERLVMKTRLQQELTESPLERELRE